MLHLTLTSINNSFIRGSSFFFFFFKVLVVPALKLQKYLNEFAFIYFALLSYGNTGMDVLGQSTGLFSSVPSLMQ